MPCDQCKDAWTWIAFYCDGARLLECDAGEHRGFDQVDLERLKEIAWVPTRANLRPMVLDCSDKRLTPMLFRQRMKILSMGGALTAEITAHCLGSKLGEDAQYTFAFDDGTVLITSDPNGATNRIKVE